MNERSKKLGCGASLALLATLMAGCDSSVGPDDRSTLSVSFAAVTEAGSGAAMAPAAVPLSDPLGRTIDIGLVQMVLAEIELERTEELEDCDFGDDCEEIEKGPVLIDFPVDGGLIRELNVPISEGSFDELEVEIEEPDEDDAATAGFLAANPGWPPEASVRVAGTFDPADGSGSQSFDVFIQGEAEIELELPSPLVVHLDPTSLNITVMVYVNEWFLHGDGSLIDPRALSANEALRERVEDNIEGSFDAFEDDDWDGEHDDH